MAWSNKLDTPRIYPLDKVSYVQNVLFKSIKREQRYDEFKLDVSKQKTHRHTDLVLEEAPPEVSHQKIAVFYWAIYPVSIKLNMPPSLL